MLSVSLGQRGGRFLSSTKTASTTVAGLSSPRHHSPASSPHVSQNMLLYKGVRPGSAASLNKVSLRHLYNKSNEGSPPSSSGGGGQSSDKDVISTTSKTLQEKWTTPVSVPIFAAGETPILPFPIYAFRAPQNFSKEAREKLIKIARSKIPLIGLFVPKVNDPNMSHHTLEDFNQVGTLVELRLEILADGAVNIVFVPFRRIKAHSLSTEAGKYVFAQVSNFGVPLPDMNKADDPDVIELRAGDLAMYNALENLEARLTIAGHQVRKINREQDIALAPYLYLSTLVQTFFFERSVLQKMHEIASVHDQQKYLLSFIKTIRVNDEAADPQANPQHRMRLMEQLNQVNQKLGVKDETTKFLDTIRERLSKLQVPADIATIVKDESDRLSYLKGSDLHSAKNYLDWISQLPWGLTSSEIYDVKRAREILDQDHYGIEDVKNRVLEAIAVMSVKNQMLGKIICLVGPPGTGKTSFAKSIARALNREFVRFSVGGLNRISEIKGHRRTYVGSMPGKIIQGLKQAKTLNPVMLLDEIDKMSYFSHMAGDPSAAILEVLDPEQNGTFIDDFLDVPFDLSKVLFICTANDISQMSAPLLDRMDIIKLDGYLTTEKTEIAKGYLIPKALKSTGLLDAAGQPKLVISDEVVTSIINNYSREPGVRQLEKNIEKICRKAALKLVVDPNSTVTIDVDDLPSYLGKSKYRSETYYEKPPPGIVMGLGANNMGGSGLFVETVAEQLGEKPELQLTGQVGDVMKESVSIAYTCVADYSPHTPRYSKNLVKSMFPENSFFQSSTLHLNWLHGGIPKDGPSGGCAVVTSLLSLALNKSVPPYITMTGEVTLHGKVLAIGGVKEKTMAGRRAGATTFIFPRANQQEFEKLPAYLRDGISVHFVDDYKEIIPIVFGPGFVDASERLFL